MASSLGAKRTLWALVFGLCSVLGWLTAVNFRRYVQAEKSLEGGLHARLVLSQVALGVVTADVEPSRARLTPLLSELSTLATAEPSERARLEQLRALVEHRLELARSDLGLAQDIGHDPAVAQSRNPQSRALSERILGLANSLDEAEQRSVAEQGGEGERARIRATWGIGLVSALTIALSLSGMLGPRRNREAPSGSRDEFIASEEYFRLLTENSSDLLRTEDLSGNVLYVSPSVERLLGYTPGEFRALPPMSLVHPDDRNFFEPDPALAVSERYKDVPLEYRILHKDGSYRWLEISYASHRDPDGKITLVQSSARDVTERKANAERLSTQAEQLRDLSLRDELTGLYNRRGFLELARQGARFASREHRTLAVVFADLNGMKQINDHFGHEEGDRALQDMAQILKTVCRDVDVVARLGGDEFVVFALDFDESGLEVLRRRLQSAIAEHNTASERPYRLSLSLGAAFSNSDKPETIEELVDRADSEMYERKRARQRNGGMSLPPPAR